MDRTPSSNGSLDAVVASVVVVVALALALAFAALFPLLFANFSISCSCCYCRLDFRRSLESGLCSYGCRKT